MIKYLLNSSYYESLLEKSINFLKDYILVIPNSNFNKINLSFIKKAISQTSGFDIFITLPKGYDEILDKLFAEIYLFIANEQFYENYINPDIELDELITHKSNKKSKKYKIVGINDKTIVLLEQKNKPTKDLNGPEKRCIDREKFFKEYVPIKRSMKNKSLYNYFKLFSFLNKLDPTIDYIPTKFNTVSVFIGSKKIFESFRNIKVQNCNLYSSIPCCYLSKEGKEINTLGISPLLYFVSNYSIAYEHIIQKDIRIKNIILFNDGLNELRQIINDQLIYNFRILGICTSPIDKRQSSIKYWEWYKEEITLLESL